MSAFAKTRAAAGYAARHTRSELARARAAVLLRDVVLAVRDLAGPAWLAFPRSDAPCSGPA